MKLRNKLILLGILVGVISCLGMNSSQASEITSVFSGKTITRNTVQNVELASENNTNLVPVTLGISKDRESRNWYVWNPLTTALDEKGNLKVDDNNNVQAQKVWKIAKYSSESSTTRDYSNLYYCLNAERGFELSTNGMAEGAKDTYSYAFNMKDGNLKSTITDLAGGKLGENYNKILWILDKSYIPTKAEKYQESSEYINLMNVAGVSIDNEDERLNLTEDDIEVVQQMAIWYFTNSESTNYKNNKFPSLYLNGTQLSLIHLYTTEYGEQITGSYRQEKAEKLFDYFITNADANYTVKTPTLTLYNTKVTVREDRDNYIVGPFSLSETNKELIKEITATLNVDATLLNSSKIEVADNAFSKVIGGEFYLEIAKNSITSNKEITIELTYKYDERNLTLLTDRNDPTNTQPVVLVEEKEKSLKTETGANIELTSVSVEKLWDDKDNQDGKRPTSVNVQLYKNNKEYGNPITLTSSNWSHSWDKLLGGYTYSVKELDKSGIKVENNGKYDNNYTATYEISDNKTTITNTYVPENTEVSITKIWQDNNNQDGKRAKYGVTLYKNGKPYGEEVELEPDTLTYTWNNLPKYENGKEIEYTVKETKKPDEYNAEYSKDTFTITNIYTPGKTSKKVIKVWNDEENKDKLRPSSVTVTLYKTVDGEKTEIESQVLNEENKWNHVWEELDKKENGKDIIYSVEENAVENYTTEYSSENYKDTDEITITNTHTPEVITGKYNILLKKVDENGNILKGAKFEIDGTEYDLTDGEQIILENEQLTSADTITIPFNIKETVVPDGYEKIEDIEIIINATIEKDEEEKSYKIKNVTGTFDGENEHENATVKLDGNTIVITIKNNPIQKKLDLALRKFITKVNDIEYSREPVVDTSTIATTGTATYKHTKQPIAVQKGDVVTYTIRVYNEGEIDGYVEKITDYIPDHLIPIITGTNGIDEEKYSKEIEFNLNWGWIISEDGKSVITMKTSKVNSETYSLMDGYENVKDTKLNAYVEGSDKLDYIDVQIKCLVETSNEILTGQYLTNIAEITEMCDGNGTSIETDRDSKKGNVVYDNLLDYKNEEALISTTDSYVPGQEDDDDFEKLVIQVYDLSLRKFITNVSRNGVAVNIGVSREPVVDTTSLVNKTSTTADYKHKKDPIEVRVGDIVTYTIRVYNEGSINGIPAEITEYIPTYLDFDPNDELNKKYGWNLKDDYKNNGVGILTTSYLKDTVLEACSYQEGAELDNTNNHEAGDLKINFIVSERPSQHTIMTNTSEISIYQYEDKTLAKDRDSGEQWEIGILEYGVNLMNKSLYDNYVKTGEITQEKANEISDYVKNIFVDYKPDYASEDYGISDYLDSKGITGEEFIKNAPNGVPEEILNQAYNVINNKNSNKEITQAYASYIDEFFQSYKGIASNKLDLTDSKYYYAGQEDDDDFEKLKIVYFDLALRKFITKVNSTDYNNRYPEIKFNDDGSITYNHTKEPVLVATGDTVIYTIRVYNEGEVAGYATQIKDNLPEGLEFDPNNEINKLYGWKMIDKDGNVTEDVDKVVAFTTNYLEKEIIDPLVELNGSKILSFKDVQIAFTVTETNTSDKILVNTAEISADSDDDIDSTPNNNVESEDDIDKEYVKVEYFDLSLKKWVTETIVTLDGKTTTTKTGFTPDSEGIAKVDIVASKLNKTTVKFKYSIKVTNEGELPGYAYEVKDYIPSGLKFVAEDNKNWEEVKDNVVVTDQLKDTLLNPGESATVEIVLTWKNSSTNLGTKTNYAEISKDSGDDIDSTPDNFNLKEDDIDDAQVILSIKTAGKTTYVGLILISIIVLAGGVYGIKKYVLK